MNPSIGPNRFCGPGAYAIICGGDTGQASAAIRAVTGKRSVFGTTPEVLLEALRRAGKDVGGPLNVPLKRPTLAAFAAHMDGFASLLLVEVTDHWVVLDARAQEACDNQSIYPMPVAKFRRRRMRVRRAWWVR